MITPEARDKALIAWLEERVLEIADSKQLPEDSIIAEAVYASMSANPEWYMLSYDRRCRLVRDVIDRFISSGRLIVARELSLRGQRTLVLGTALDELAASL